MIHKNVKTDKVMIPMVVDFAEKGRMTAGVTVCDSDVMLYFKNAKPTEAELQGIDKSISITEIRPQVVLLFGSVEAVDLMMEMLEEVRNRLL